jgi:hypothetical protein
MNQEASSLSQFVDTFGHAVETGRAAPPADAPGVPALDDLAARKARHVKLGIFRSPKDAPPRCEPNGGDRTMLSYHCPRPECAALPMRWSSCAEPRAWGVDQDFMPEHTWCPVCGTEGELLHVESPQDLLKRTAPELFEGKP